MNKIYKVIWNEARNAYVVVSEIAKNHGSKSSSTKKLLAMLIATGVMTCASFNVLAAQPSAAETAKSQYVAFKDDSTSLYDGQIKKFGGYKYIYDATNKYWVREGYVLTVDENGGEYTPLSQKDVRADVAYTRTGVPEGILQSVTSTVSASGTVTNMGESLNKITAGSFAGVSHAGGTEVAGSWDYIIKDDSWEGKVAPSNYTDGYVNLYAGENAAAPKGFVNTDSKDLIWDDSRQAYFYKNQRVDYSNMYVINGKLGVFTDAARKNVYTGTVYGKNNEILMTVKDKDNKLYSYWAAEVTDPSATMATYRVEEYNKNLAKLVENDDALNRNDIKEVTLTKDTNSATIGLMRNGDKAVDGAITVTSGGGTGGSDAGNDTFVKISNGKTEQTFATGSKVEAIGSKDATTGIKINGEDYTIKSGSVVSVAQNAAKKTTTLTVDGKATTITDTDTHNALDSAKLDGKKLTITGQDKDSVEVDLSSIDTDTKYTEGKGIAIDENNGNAISVKLKEDENNLEVTPDGLALKKNLTVDSVAAGDTIVNTNGLTIGTGDKGIVLSTTNVSMGGQQIHNVANGTNDNDAVNVSQLKETNTKVENLKVEAGKHTTLVNGENTTVEPVGDGKDGKQYKVNVDLSQYAKTEDVAVVYDANGSLKSTNATSVGSSAIALGKEATAVANSIAIGDSSIAGYKGTVLGTNAKSNREGATLVGYNTNSFGLYSTVVGTNATINTNGKTVYTKIVQGAAATVVGAMNKIDNTNGEGYSGVANNVMGAANTIEGSNGVTIQGSGNTVTDAYKDMDITYADGLAILGGDYSVLAKKESGAIAVVGGANTVSRQTDSTVIGYDNRLIGGEENISHDVFMAGSHNRLNNVSDSIVMGNDNKISDRSNVISFGHKNAITANNAVAIGNGAGVSVEGGVALGVGSVASTAAGALGYGAAEGETGIAWKATNGAVSVGSSVEGKKITRQITNVAAGTADTDAVNVAQLKKVSEAAASASQGWKLKTKNGNASDVKPGDEVEFDGDANIQVGNNGNIVSVTLKNQLTGIQSITGAGEGAGSISFANDGIKFNNKVTINKDGKITGVAAGAITETSTDAVNGSQLYAVKETANKGWKLSTGKGEAVNVAPGETVDFSGDKNISVSNDKTKVKVELNKDLVGIESISNGDAKMALNGAAGTAGMINGKGASIYMQDGYTVINSKVAFDQNGKISGVAAGAVTADSTDAVNGSQLHQTNENVAALDKRVTQNEADIAQNKADIAQNKADIAQNKADIAQNKADIAQNKADIAANRTDIDKNAADIAQNKTDIKNLGNRVTNVEELAKKHTTVTQGDNIAVTESTNKDGGKEYKVALNKNINLDNVTTGQTVMNNDGLKVGKDVSVTATAVIAGKTSISDEGVKVGDKTYISDKGLNANDQKVTNVAAGELSATSKDAVNGSQLYETNQAIANNATNISSLSHSISNLDNRVNKVGAGAAALAALHPLDFDPDAKWDFAAGYGNYRGANAAAVGAYYRPNEDTMFSVGGTFGNGENMVNAGVSFKLGSGSSHVSTSRVAMAKEIKELRGELEAMKSAMLDANAGKKIDTSKLQLFPDVPQNHWAYEYVAQLAGNGMIEGYPDGNFAGDRPMTRYEFAAILYRAMTKGAVLSDKILSEFSHELEYFTVDTIAKDKAGNPTIQRVRTVKENKNK